MNNIYYKNRTLVYIIFTLSIFYIGNIFASSAALSIEKSLDIVGSNDTEDVKIIYITIPQGSSATEISPKMKNQANLENQKTFQRGDQDIRSTCSNKNY